MINFGYRRIFAGLLVSILHINLGPIQLLPSFVGFLMVANGINKICAEYTSPQLRIAHNFALGLSFVSFLQWIYTFTQGDVQSWLFSSLFTILHSLAFLATFYYLFQGTIQLLQQFQHSIAADRFLVKQRCFVVLYTLAICGELITQTMTLVVPGIVITVFVFIQIIWLAVSFYGLRSYKFFLSDTVHTEEPGLNVTV